MKNEENYLQKLSLIHEKMCVFLSPEVLVKFYQKSGIGLDKEIEKRVLFTGDLPGRNMRIIQQVIYRFWVDLVERFMEIVLCSVFLLME